MSRSQRCGGSRSWRGCQSCRPVLQRHGVRRRRQPLRHRFVLRHRPPPVLQRQRAGALADDAALAPAQQGTFGLDGIVATDGALNLTKLDTGDLYRVAIGADGRAGAVTRIAVSPALASPDGMRLIDAHTLLVVENIGALLRIALSGDIATATATALADGLDQPTGVIVARGSAWVSQGQLGRLFAQPPQPPNLPFSVVRVKL